VRLPLLRPRLAFRSAAHGSLPVRLLVYRLPRDDAEFRSGPGSTSIRLPAPRSPRNLWSPC